MAATVFEALPAYLFRGAMKEATIAYLANADCSIADRRCWYRSWCSATQTKWRAEDADRAAPWPATVSRESHRRQGSLF